jgi:hypothetical protein
METTTREVFMKILFSDKEYKFENVTLEAFLAYGSAPCLEAKSYQVDFDCDKTEFKKILKELEIEESEVTFEGIVFNFYFCSDFYTDGGYAYPVVGFDEKFEKGIKLNEKQVELIRNKMSSMLELLSKYSEGE